MLFFVFFFFLPWPSVFKLILCQCCFIPQN